MKKRDPSTWPPADRVLRALVVEDSEYDAELLLHRLADGGYSCSHRRVQSADEMRAALNEPWDIVFSDFSIPGFGGMEALKLVHASGLDVPFVIVSGTIGEETAVEALKAGANDYIVKGRLARLIPVVNRELREAASRRRRREAEEALGDSEVRHRMLFESCPIPVLIWQDGTRRIIDANSAALGTYGYSLDELRTLTISSIEIEPREAEASTKPKGKLVRHRRSDGSIIDVDVVSYPLELKTGLVRVSFVSDVTEKHRADEQLRRAQKLEVVGRLAGGIAHDFNNMLTPIMSYTALIERELKADDPIRSDLAEIRTAGERAQGLVQQLMAFSHDKVVQPQPLDLNASIAAMERMLLRVIGEDVELRTTLGRDAETIFADPSEIEQVVMNLVVNARDAMPKGGRLAMETRNVRLSPEQARDIGVEPGRFVELSVSDTGTGMDAATRARIFEPLFTTKPSGKGTGLGLATVHAIVTKNRGAIQVHTERGAGTTFRLLFPRHGGMVAGSGQHAISAIDVTGTETVLLVEDDELVRRAVRAILRRNGYNVLEARSGGDALIVAERHATAIHLLITDVVMPNMGGRELAERLVASHSEMKVLYMSGYTSDEALRQEIVEAGVPFIKKPFTPEILTRRVRELLDESAERERPSL